MNKAIYIIISLLLSNIIVAQIGVNTENPKTLFHIDGASTPATTNPTTGSVTVAEAVDDVVITNLGNVGIGTMNPSTRLDVITTTPAGAIKIVDTTQGAGKVLVSDGDGVGTWGAIIGSWFALLDVVYTPTYQTALTIRQLKGFTTGVISSTLEGSVHKANGTISVPYTGKYRVTIAGHWGCNRVGSAPYLVAPYVYVNGVAAWSGASIGYSSSWGISPTFVSILTFASGDVITLYTNETAANNANLTSRCSFILEFIE